MLQVDNGVPVSMNALDINSPQSEVAGNVICTARGEQIMHYKGSVNQHVIELTKKRYTVRKFNGAMSIPQKGSIIHTCNKF